MKVTIIGCGPAGLLAAYGFTSAGHNVKIVSVRAKSVMKGAMYLHQPIPGINNPDPDYDVFFKFIGSREGYASKVYGNPIAPCSWDKFYSIAGPNSDGEIVSAVPAWSLGDVYNKLWNMFYHKITDKSVKVTDISRLLKSSDLLVNTAPMMRMCEDWGNHQFLSSNVRIDVSRRSTGRPKRGKNSGPGEVIYNGELSTRWYRSSHIEGLQCTEYPDFAGAPGHYITKPVRTTCDCFPEMVRLGRFGAWDKNVLTHHAYLDAIRIGREHAVQ